jgi:phosphoribosylformylglycinamidine cyclo-ligase
MPDEPLTYRSSGVDVNVNNEANERIKHHVRRTRNGRVVTEPGLFSGGVSLHDFRRLEKPLLTGTLGYRGRAGGGRAAADTARAVLDSCLAGQPAGAEPVAFLDYIASSRLDASGVEGLVGGFADALTADRPAAGPGIPLVGGETAEMPGVFRPGAWEVVGSLYGVAEGAGRPAGTPTRETADLSAMRGCREPALLLSMDGVGTKAKIGVRLRRTRGFAFDILHHSLNDILCQGARGVGVTVYVGCHAADGDLVEPFLEGVRECARREGLALLDFTVREDPEVYLPGEIDICASIAGLVDRDGMVTGAGISAGDRLIGLGSDGLHTNGYSLARRALLERAGLALEERLPDLGTTLGEALLAPHRNYAPPVLELLAGRPSAIHGIAHITGGGLQDNLARILPRGLGMEIRKGAWPVPPIFALIRRSGGIPEQDPQGKGMYETFNMGVGLVLVAAAGEEVPLLQELTRKGERAWPIGQVVGNTSSEPHERVRLIG